MRQQRPPFLDLSDLLFLVVASKAHWLHAYSVADCSSDLRYLWPMAGHCPVATTTRNGDIRVSDPASCRLTTERKVENYSGEVLRVLQVFLLFKMADIAQNTIDTGTSFVCPQVHKGFGWINKVCGLVNDRIVKYR